WLTALLSLTGEAGCRYVLGGYSLAGLFALWTATRTEVFSGIAAASPSVWFPGFTEYLKTHPLRAGRVYLSLGDREERTKNPLMATVSAKIRETHALLAAAGTDCTLVWNEGNHFREPELRTAKAFAWLLS
ncbi:MAG: alpha/beta hydrolase-fold protein, partial [bacterium]